jgi:hypothetical protein
MAKDLYGFPVQPAATPPAPPAQGEDPDANRALSMSVATLGALAASPCSCWLGAIAAIPLGWMAWRAARALEGRTEPLVVRLRATANGTGIAGMVVGTLVVLGGLVYAAFLAFVAMDAGGLGGF